MNGLHFASNLNLPVDYATMRGAIVGLSGSGKTNSGVIIAEELLNRNQQIVVLDPTNRWYGLRSAKNGASNACQVVIFGGSHRDLPLEASSGTLIADFVVEHGVSVILSTRHLDPEEQARVCKDFAVRLYQRKGDAEHGTPLHCIWDEAHDLVPEQPFGNGAAESTKRIVRLITNGRSSGIGHTIITQRATSVKKGAIGICEVFFVHRTIWANDLDYLEKVFASHAPEGMKEFRATVSKLKQGECWVWSPEFLETFKRVQVRARESFDSSRTPKVGEKVIKPVMAKVNLEKIRQEIEDLVEQVKADDPEMLKDQVRILKGKIRQLEAARPAIIAAPEVNIEAVQLEERERCYNLLRGKVTDVLTAHAETLIGQLNELPGKASEWIFAEPPFLVSQYRQPSVIPPVTVRVPMPLPKPALATTSSGPGVKMAKACRAILSVLVQHGESSKAKVAAISGYSASGGGFNNALSECRGNGWLIGSDPIDVTKEGSKAVGKVDPLPSHDELLRMWLNKLGKAEGDILMALIDGRPADKAEVGRRTHREHTGGGFNNALSRLRTLELIQGSGTLSLTKDFAEALAA